MSSPGASSEEKAEGDYAADAVPPDGKYYFSFRDFISSVDDPIINEYRFGKEVGKGALSRVYQAVCNDTGEEFAVKVYNNTQLSRPTLGMDEMPYESVAREVKLMRKLEHRCIIAIIEVVESPTTDSTLLVMPFAANGTLRRCLDKQLLHPSSIAVCFHQVAEGLRYMHSMNAVHRDVKPDNILCFSETYFVISDLSVSTEIENDEMTLDDTKGSPAFLSPEECSGEDVMPKPCDVWAFGISLYQAVFGHFPFDLDAGHGQGAASAMVIVTSKLETEELTFPELPEGHDPKVIELLSDVLKKDPRQRPTFAEIVGNEYFKDAWPIDEELRRWELSLEKCHEEEEEEEEAKEEIVKKEAN